MKKESFLDLEADIAVDLFRFVKGKRVLFLDVDETLARTQERLADLLKKRHGISVEFAKMTKRKIQYAVTKCEREASTEDEIKECFLDVLNLEETYSESLQYIGYAQLARKAHNVGIKVIALTHRAHVEKKYPHATAKWFEKNDIPVDMFIFGDVDQKVNFLKKADSVVGQGSAFCDDDPDTIRLCLGLSMQNVSSFLVSDRPWTNPETSELDLSGLEKVACNPDDVWNHLSRN